MATIDRTAMILAIVLSCCLWLYVRLAQRVPDKIRVISNVPVTPVNAMAAGYLYRLHTDSQNVTVKIKGPEELVNSVVREELTASIDLSKLRVGQAKDILLPVLTGKLPPGVQLMDISRVTVLIMQKAQRAFPVTVAFIPPPAPGMTVGQYLVTPQTVTVEGTSGDVGRVKFVIVRVDPNKPFTADQSIIPLPVDDEGRPVEGVTVSRPTVMVHMASPTATQPAIHP